MQRKNIIIALPPPLLPPPHSPPAKFTINNSGLCGGEWYPGP